VSYRSFQVLLLVLGRNRNIFLLVSLADLQVSTTLGSGSRPLLDVTCLQSFGL
jgi:hypothetical protein